VPVKDGIYWYSLPPRVHGVEPREAWGTVNLVLDHLENVPKHIGLNLPFHCTARVLAPHVTLLPVKALELSGLVHRYQRSYVLRGTSLTLEANQILALYGANGAGKTTLLKIIATSLVPTRGGGTVLGIPFKNRLEIRGRVGIVSHNLGFYPDLSGTENLEFTLAMHSNAMSIHNKKANISAALERVGLDTQNRVRAYSSGMRKRLALAKMLLLLPDLILLDEPFAALDPDGKNLVENLMLEQVKRGATLIIASHEPERTSKIATRSVMLEQGQIREVV
jgi:heme exporter protein A